MAKIADLYADIRANTSGLQKGLQDAKSQLKGFGEDVKAAGKGGAISFSDVTLGAAKLGAAALAAGVALKKAFDFAAEGAGIASLGVASRKLASSYGVNMTEVVTAVKKASYNTITEYEAMKSANLAMTMGVTKNADEIANLLQIATMRGRAFGLTTEEAFDRITRGIGRGSIKILDDLGFNMKGVTGQTAMFAAVMKQGNEELDKMGGFVMDVSTPFQRAQTIYKDFFNEIKMAAAYGFMPLIATPEEAKSIQEDRGAAGMAAGDWDEYSKAAQFAARQQNLFIDGSGNLVRKLVEVDATTGKVTQSGFELIKVHDTLTKGEFFRAHGMEAMTEHYREMYGWTGQVTEAENKYNDELSLQAGLSNDIANAQARFSAEMEKAGRSTDKQAAAMDNLNESYEDFILSSMGSLGATSEQTMGVAYAFGEIDDKSLAVFGAIQGLLELGRGAVETTEMISKLRGHIQDLDSVSLQDKSMTIKVNYLITMSGGGFSSFAGSGPTSGGTYWGQKVFDTRELKKHGGTVYGGQHGMVVPPGFSNDGMPVMVSSGERLDVTPAGNKNGGESELIGMIADLKYTLDGLPRIIRDAVKMA